MSATEIKDMGAPPLQKFKDLESAEARVEATLGKIESKTPGRMRVRLKPELRDPEDMARIQAILSQHPDVRKVTINPSTGSMVIEHDLQRDSRHLFESAFKESELILGAAFELPVEEEGEDGEEEEGDAYGKLDQQLADTLYKIDKAVYKKTGLRFRGQILAGSIAALGLAQIAVYGIPLETLSGPFLIWIGWDIYHRVSKEPPLDAEEDAVAEDGAGDSAGAGAEDGAEDGAGDGTEDGAAAANAAGDAVAAILAGTETGAFTETTTDSGATEQAEDQTKPASPSGAEGAPATE